jgi:hypothetical protein
MTDRPIPNLSGLKRSDIQVARNGNQINLYYITKRPNGKPKKTPLHVKTNCWTCPFGRDDQGKLMVVISDDQYFDVEALDRFGRDVCKYFFKHGQGHDHVHNHDQGRNLGLGLDCDLVPPPDDLPYKSLVQHTDGLDVLQLQMSDQTRVFDSNGVLLPAEQANQWTGGQFSGNFLLSLGLRVWEGEGSSKFYWAVQPVQIKVKRHFTLPEGCMIFDSEETFHMEMDKRKKTPASRPKERVDEEPVADFDPDVNELLD